MCSFTRENDLSQNRTPSSFLPGKLSFYTSPYPSTPTRDSSVDPPHNPCNTKRKHSQPIGEAAHFKKEYPASAAVSPNLRSFPISKVPVPVVPRPVRGRYFHYALLHCPSHPAPAFTPRFFSCPAPAPAPSHERQFLSLGFAHGRAKARLR